MSFGDQILNDGDFQALSEGIAANSQAISQISIGGSSGSACAANSQNISANSVAISDNDQEISSLVIDIADLSQAHSQTHSELQLVSTAVSAILISSSEPIIYTVLPNIESSVLLNSSISLLVLPFEPIRRALNLRTCFGFFPA